MSQTCSYSVMKRSTNCNGTEQHVSTCIFESSIHLNRTSHLLHNAEEPATSQGAIHRRHPTFPKRCPMRVGNFPRSEHKSPSGSSSEVMIIPPKVNHSSRLLKGSHCGSTIQPACQGYARYQSPFPFLTWLIEENCTSGLNSLRIAATDFEVVITLGQKSQKKTPELKTSQIVLIRIQLKESF